MLLLPFLGRKALWSPSMYSRDLFLQDAVDEPVSCQSGLLRELRRYNDSLVHLATASYLVLA